ncbi:MAG TPA: glycoside hydrolase family 15 protein, partial [Bdellovibrionota bacterium]
LNRNHPLGPAIGRHEGDGYYGGNAWFLLTAGFAEYYYRYAAVLRNREEIRAKADAFLETVLTYIPENGQMAEQFSKVDGKPVGALDLTWSYAALLSAVLAREELARSSIRYDAIPLACER